MSCLSQQSTLGGQKDWFRRAVPRAIIFALLWGTLTDGNLSAWTVGIPVIAAATLLSMKLLPHYRWRWRFLALLRFIPFFLRRSLSGSVDVAWRALSPRLPLNPRFLEYDLRLPHGPAPVFFVNVVSLLPGTVGVEIQKERLIVHALDGDAAILDELRAIEEAIAALFGATLTATAVRGGQPHA